MCRTWLHERGLPDRLLVLVGSALVAHSAVHRVMGARRLSRRMDRLEASEP
jgi:hypothetical protein